MSIPNPSLYQIFSYERGPDKQPEIHGRTGSWKVASDTAADLAKAGIHAAVKNTETGNVVPFRPTETET